METVILITGSSRRAAPAQAFATALCPGHSGDRPERQDTGRRRPTGNVLLQPSPPGKRHTRAAAAAQPRLRGSRNKEQGGSSSAGGTKPPAQAYVEGTVTTLHTGHPRPKRGHRPQGPFRDPRSRKHTAEGALRRYACQIRDVCSPHCFLNSESRRQHVPELTATLAILSPTGGRGHPARARAAARTFPTASVCSSSQPTRAWPDSCSATTFCSSLQSTWLFLAAPERTPSKVSSGAQPPGYAARRVLAAPKRGLARPTCVNAANSSPSGKALTGLRGRRHELGSPAGPQTWQGSCGPRSPVLPELLTPYLATLQASPSSHC